MQFLYSHITKLELEQKNRPNPRMRRQVIKIRAEINELETRSTVEQINKTWSWFFERINKIDKSLARFIQKNREKTQIDKIMNERGEITTNTNEIGRMLETYQQLYANKLNNLEEMDAFLEIYKLPRLNRKKLII